MSAPDANGWMPIETAPKDGTDVLVTSREPLTSSQPQIAGYFDDGWFSEHAPFTRIEGLTHWQPLPEPPTTTNTSRSGQ